MAGPMASCASIDIEDATQHLRDILKLDRPAGGEPGEVVRLLARWRRYGVDLNRFRVPQVPLARFRILPFDCGGQELESWMVPGYIQRMAQTPGCYHPVSDHSALILNVLAEGKAPPRNPPNPSGFLASKLPVF